MNEILQIHLKALRLTGMAEKLSIRLHEASSNHLAYADFLSRLVDDELMLRGDKLLHRRLKMAGFPGMKSIETFDFDFNSSIHRQTVSELATCTYIPKGQNILMLGPPGVGKTHLAIALGVSAIEKGYSVIYRSIFDLAEEMIEARVENKGRELIQALIKPDLLIIDELGMKKLPPHSSEDLLELFHRRYQKKSTMICTNRPIEEWGAYLEDTAAATSILDRFLEGVHLLKITGKSYRLGRKPA